VSSNQYLWFRTGHIFVYTHCQHERCNSVLTVGSATSQNNKQH